MFPVSWILIKLGTYSFLARSG